VILGLVLAILGIIFKTSSSQRPVFLMVYRYVPPLFLCYFIPSLLTTFHIVDTGTSQLYFVATHYLLPASLILITLSIDFREIIRLGPKLIIVFLAGSIGVIIGGPVSIYIIHFFSPSTISGVGPDAVWRGLSAIAASWIGGGGNQAALYEIFKPSDRLYSIMITIDIIGSQLWMALLIYAAAKSDKIDKILKADSSVLDGMKEKMRGFTIRTARIPTLADFMVIIGVAFGLTALSQVFGDRIAGFFTQYFPFTDRFSLTSNFFWLIVLATGFSIIMSFTSFRNYEGAGASKIGSVFIYFLVATIGMKMDIFKIFDYPGLFILGAIWITIHALFTILAGKLIKAPFFYLAVGSQANIGGVASAPVVAAAFHPSFAPIGVLLAIFGYTLGTYGGWLTGILMQWISGVLGLGS
jgi:uncharacterized membrane protein